MAERGPGWPTVLALALVTITFSVVHPVLLMVLPLAMLLVAMPPRRPMLVAAGAALLILMFAGPRTGLWYVERGWALLVGGWFLVAVLVRPGWPFLARALVAVGGAAATAGVIVAAAGGWAELDWSIAARYREAAEAVSAAWPGMISDSSELVRQATELPARVFPAMLGVGSLAALGVAWWSYRRLARPGGEAMGRLPEFRFPDHLIWLLIAGLVLLLFPAAGWTGRVGTNVVFFMGALYVLRGAAVVLALVGPNAVMLVVLGVMTLLLYPIVMAGTLLVGVTDTWLDLRSGRRAVNDEG